MNYMSWVGAQLKELRDAPNFRICGTHIKYMDSEFKVPSQYAHLRHIKYETQYFVQRKAIVINDEAAKLLQSLLHFTM